MKGLIIGLLLLTGLTGCESKVLKEESKTVDCQINSIRVDDGAEKMAQDLGFDCRSSLQDWADQNPEIWGNENGGSMFSDGGAFNQDSDSGFTLQTIIDHWKGVKKRALKLS